MAAAAQALGWLARLGADDHESDGVRTQRLVLIAMSIGVVPIAGSLWASSYDALGEPRAMTAVLVNIAWMLVGFAWLAATRNYSAFRTIALLGLSFGTVTALSLGGYAESGGLIMLGLFVPVVSLLDGDRRRARRWLLFFIAQLFVAAAIEVFVWRPDEPIDAVALSWVPNTVLLSVVTYWVLAYSTRKRTEALEALVRERARSEELLLNVLPSEVVETLKSGPEVIAEPYEDASIMFADIVGFTPLSTRLSAEAMVELLNEVFSHFDSLCEKHGVEKMRTIGDGYMVASGLPTPRTDHADALADLALDMMAYVSEMRGRRGEGLDFRIGINSGPLVAGVIGHKKFQYDVWGDTVNTAARMESHGVAGRIQVTDETRKRLGDRFSFEARGEIDVKGKGRMRAWLLLGRVDDAPADRA